MAAYLINLLLLFFCYSVIGWCIEVALKYHQYHRFINRGFFIGPWLPIYGSGCVLITLAVDALSRLSYMESSYGSVFAVSFVLCGAVEYGASYFMEKRFHARWWDYSTKPMNLNGRIWIGNLILFGLGGVIVVKFGNPLLLGLFSMMSLKLRTIIGGSLLAVFASDYIITHFVLKMVKHEVEGSQADNTEEISSEVRRILSDRNMFARRFANAYPEVVYRTDKVRARISEIKRQTDEFRKDVEKYISGKLETTSQIRTNLIAKQQELILRLYRESDATAEDKALKAQIDREIEKLKNRKLF